MMWSIATFLVALMAFTATPALANTAIGSEINQEDMRTTVLQYSDLIELNFNLKDSFLTYADYLQSNGIVIQSDGGNHSKSLY